MKFSFCVRPSFADQEPFPKKSIPDEQPVPMTGVSPHRRDLSGAYLRKHQIYMENEKERLRVRQEKLLEISREGYKKPVERCQLVLTRKDKTRRRVRCSEAYIRREEIYAENEKLRRKMKEEKKEELKSTEEIESEVKEQIRAASELRTRVNDNAKNYYMLCYVD
ncbi:hypothetical protein QR680_018586 [Steinernema hermaphroditum]|uniref:Uncharacterized protein n=1 Tax=Steinernema hermaphroditum TaxID=289476 RepID=A0AA39HIE8_9BILA|nr:hypothetical protein QR680_018586 [Steinernema hermaphroditum]